MNTFPRPLIAGLLTLAVYAMSAAGASAGAIAITGAWARATPPGVKNGGGYMTIQNHGAADRLIGVTGTAAVRIELHNHIMNNGVMSMRRVEHIEVPAHGKAVLQPGGFHVMMMGLTEQLKPGTMVMLTLKFENGGEVMVHMPVRKTAPEAMPGMTPENQHQHKHGKKPAQ